MLPNVSRAEFLVVLLVAFFSSRPIAAQEAVQIAIVQDKDIDECSGIAASYQHPDMLWMHNDSGDKANLYLVDLNGKTRAKVRLQDVDPFDWEDMCSFQADGVSWLLIGDVGDNSRNRGKKKTKD